MNGLDFAIGLQKVHVREQVLPHGIEQRRPVQQPRHREERVHLHPCVVGAAFGEQAISVLVDPFSQPVVDSVHILRRREERVDSGKGRADNPAVVRSVNAAGDQGLADSQQKLAQCLLHTSQPRVVHAARNPERAGDGLHHEGGVGRRREIARIQRAVGILGVEKCLCATLHPRNQALRFVERRLRGAVGGDERRDISAASGPQRAWPSRGRLLEHAVDHFVVALQEPEKELVPFAGGVGAWSRPRIQADRSRQRGDCLADRISSRDVHGISSVSLSILTLPRG